MSMSSTLVLGLLASATSALVARDSTLSARQGPAYSYLGCYTEGTGVRALGAYNSVNYTTMTVEICAGLCLPTYTLFGLEYGGECWCANVFGTGAVAAPETECSMPCGGSATEICGAGNRLSVYSTTPAAPAAPVHVPAAGGYTRTGCYTEGNGTRALSGAEEVNYATMTVEICAAFCATGSFQVMGVEYGGECYCGSLTQFSASGSVVAPDSECSMLCAGNSTEYCGAGNRLDLYQTTAP
ncbi:WSC containing protein [Venustampulla echinocandica]|uniref:WSC containing protein n=1 Tax=Venustampulla echinocandica TaxID=2656787 RepID=A0A370TG70_9HELO|nr:WSC containing protein [Venustampulla echinocandica]RDL33881.1 WSC containing protein [Venustampulla echinocandica]